MGWMTVKNSVAGQIAAQRLVGVVPVFRVDGHDIRMRKFTQLCRLM